MRIAFLGGIFPQENIKDILSNSRGVVQSAADALQKSLIDGLGAYKDNIDIINLPFLGSYPKRYKKLFSPSNPFEITSNYGSCYSLKGKNVPYCNLSFFKYNFIRKATYNSLLSWAERYSQEEKIIIVYSLFSSFLKPAFSIREKYTNTKVLCIVPDLPQFMSAGGNSWMRSFLKKKSCKETEALYDKIDGFIILTKYMAEPLRIGNRPYGIIEGIYNSHDEKFSYIKPKSEETRTVLYAGTLARRYGIMRLVEAFTLIPDDNIQLIICGEGDAKEDIERIAQNDRRIVLKGNVPRKDVLDLIASATVLVNPRTPEGEFTKYSFPSKTMEYLASGTPTILYELPGIDSEYYDYCIALKDTSISALANAILKVLSMPESSRNEFGKRARDFILSKKNPQVQVTKLLDVISNLSLSH